LEVLLAKVRTEITYIGFQIQENQTIATVEFKSDAGIADQGTPWDGGKRVKAFPPNWTVVNIIQKEITTYDFMRWERVE
jgi:hypothetical protein